MSPHNDAVTTVRLRPAGWIDELPDPLPGSVEPSHWAEIREAQRLQREAEAKAARRAKLRAYVAKVFGIGTAASVASGMR